MNLYHGRTDVLSLDTDRNFVFIVRTLYKGKKEVQFNKLFWCLSVIFSFLSSLVWMLWSSVSSFNCLSSLHLEFRLALWVCIFLGAWLSTIMWYKHSYTDPFLSFFLSLTLTVSPFGKIPIGIFASALLVVWEAREGATGKYWITCNSDGCQMLTLKHFGGSEGMICRLI